MNALSSTSNHLTSEAIDYLWAANFDHPDHTKMTGEGAPHGFDGAVLDWRGFLQHVLNFAGMHRPETPICLRSRKSKIDQAMRFSESPDKIPPMRWEGQEKLEGDIKVVADKLCILADDLDHRPQDVGKERKALNYVEELRTRAMRGAKNIKAKMSKAQMEDLLRGKQRVNRDELVDILWRHLEPEPDAATEWTISARSWDPAELRNEGTSAHKVTKADLRAVVNVEAVDNDDDLEVPALIKHLYQGKSNMQEANDALNPAIRQLRPKRQRPKHGRYENYWRARHSMEMLFDAVLPYQSGNAGRLPASKLFKLLDVDGDSFVNLTDLQQCYRKYKVEHDVDDLHAVMTALDPKNKGSVDIGEFTRHFVVCEGSWLDKMAQPIAGAYEYGGTAYAGAQKNLRQDQIPDGFTRRGNTPRTASELSTGRSEPELSPSPQRSPERRAHSETRSVRSQASSCSPLRSYRSPAKSARSARSAASQSTACSTPESWRTRSSCLTKLYSDPQRVSDILKSRCEDWKAHWEDLYDEPPGGRFAYTLYPDTRHVTEPTPDAASFLPPGERWKTTQSMAQVWSVPDVHSPQRTDEMKRNATRDFRLERIRKRQGDMAERRELAEVAAKEFDEARIRRKAFTLYDWERRVPLRGS